ncbi:aspartate-semialdehyde dehydrogenase, partial [Pseudomonas simiae]
PAVTLSFAPRATAVGCSVIDLSGALSVEQAPQVVPEANAHVLDGLERPFQLGSPSPSATHLAVVLAPLRGLLDIQRVSVTANLAMSSQGREAVSELARQTAELLNMRPLEPKVFDRQVAFNLLAQVGTPDAQGHTALEKRLVHELRAVLELPLLKISATCVQAPVFFGDSLTVSLQLGAPVDLAAVNRLLDAAPGIERVEEGDYPTAVGDAVGQDVVYVGRVRAGVDDPAELNLWLTSDNVRKGAALNAVQLAQLLIKGLA